MQRHWIWTRPNRGPGKRLSSLSPVLWCIAAPHVAKDHALRPGALGAQRVDSWLEALEQLVQPSVRRNDSAAAGIEDARRGRGAFLQLPGAAPRTSDHAEHQLIDWSKVVRV